MRKVLPHVLAVSLPLSCFGCDTGDDCPGFTPETRTGTFYVDPKEVDLQIPDSGVPDADCPVLCVQGALSLNLSRLADAPATMCVATLYDAGVVQVSVRDYTNGCVGGRRPDGFDSATVAACDEVGAWLARAAALEAVSVPAFRILAAELRAHDAPAVLVSAALRAAKQETRHMETMMRLARRRGALPMPPVVAARPIRTLEVIAIENAVEGGVREAYGALAAIEQARSAADAAVRGAFAQIAPDELEHAALAAEIDQWARARLSRVARGRVAEARGAAHEQLVAEVAHEPPGVLRIVLGLPDATRASDLAAALAVT